MPMGAVHPPLCPGLRDSPPHVPAARPGLPPSRLSLISLGSVRLEGHPGSKAMGTCSSPVGSGTVGCVLGWSKPMRAAFCPDAPSRRWLPPLPGLRPAADVPAKLLLAEFASFALFCYELHL